jgi:hypothetical protein
MAVIASNLKLFKTVNGLGGGITATVVTPSNVLDAFTGDETTAGKTEYHCVYVKNEAAQTAFASKIFINSETAHPGVNATIGLGSSAISAQEQTIASETTAPGSVTFAEAASEGAALVIGDLTAGQTKAVWLRVVVGAGTTAKDAYSISVTIRVDTGE